MARWVYDPLGQRPIGPRTTTHNLSNAHSAYFPTDTEFTWKFTASKAGQKWDHYSLGRFDTGLLKKLSPNQFFYLKLLIYDKLKNVCFLGGLLSHQLHNFCSICEADMLKKPDQRYLTALQPGQPAFLQNALKVKCTVMCIRIKFYRFGGVFQHICLTFYATFKLS